MRLAPTTIAGRLLLSAVLFVTAALVVAGVVLTFILHQVVSDQVDQRLQAQASSLVAALSIDAGGQMSIVPGLDGPPFDRRGSGWYWQIDGADQTLQSRSLAGGSLKVPPPPFDWRHLFSNRPTATDTSDSNGRSLHVITVTSQLQGRPVTVNVSAPAAAISGPLTRALVWLLPSIGILGLGLIFATLLQIRVGLSPLRKLRLSLQDVRSGASARVPTAQPAELMPVVAELNALISENEERLASARLSLANMAHSLKTPLASLSLALSEAGRDPTGALQNLTGQIDTRIRHHLGRARADAGAGHGRSRTDVGSHLSDLTGIMDKIYRERRISLSFSVEPDLVAACEEQDFDELAGNLIDNAFKWASTSVAVTAVKNNGKAVITITDDGEGIPQHAMSRVLQPGQRLDETVPGHGFGLSVSQDLVSLYGGSLRLEGAQGQGLKVTIELQAA
ncbi:sensor histidine kinase [Pararhizobium qamdonense]|uniref:sensor histidine kinase n=1 Tax=Pararhizobium qamdonense TaxID=3031126 RepID=UPI0023E1B5AA|nr:HAMP domain-containing sensor histidine kinase [Pararhizobium qamdonense]